MKGSLDIHSVIKPLEIEDFSAVIALGNHVHGEGYLTMSSLMTMRDKGIKAGVNASFVLHQQETLIGFRLTYAPGQWQIDQWCSPTLWGVDVQDLCYFKCNTIDPLFQGQGSGGRLLTAAITAVKKQRGLGGVSHLWQQSPNNAAVKYFTKAGGELIATHLGRWSDPKEYSDYECVLCGCPCQCSACEMLLRFN
ncbi:GNAT family N-acetyltransferase [Shewanella surugensis]|uniref:GNAT family N-acetyltransferase n=1 Tax=Shewanella surugensis TaxID=212020 RepID=A0ABT0L7Y7_9GAMM|nr:GNAT family N-acetyltransferase [Shewanella surugensis]MCL1123763.1 GNAT family N-acetyltransferase [Shewanella surugensis]